jgi:hypothetical protein
MCNITSGPIPSDRDSSKFNPISDQNPNIPDFDAWFSWRLSVGCEWWDFSSEL